MKKLLLLAAFAFAAMPAFAQNSAITNQSGTNNTADVDQTASVAGGATFESTQGEHGNVIDAEQVGKNTAFIEQSSTGLPNSTGGHEATISQTGGDNNFINLSQSFGTGGLGPKGAHDATITQVGSDNVVGGTWDGTTYTADPAEQDSRSDRTATVNQTGDFNTANFLNGGTLTIDQMGNDNTAETQGGNVVNVDQIGDNNSATSTKIKTSTIYQFGNDNVATAQAFGASANNTVDINQSGDFNIATAMQFRSGTFTVDQDGDYNSAVVDLGSGGGGASSTTAGLDYDITQDAGTFGTASGSNSFEATVRLNDNAATVEQTLTGVGMNSIVLEQLSEGNTFTGTQTGVGNSQTVTQD